MSIHLACPYETAQIQSTFIVNSHISTANRETPRPQAYPGSLCRTLAMSILIYEQEMEI